ncbi:MAG: hypothetical protein OXU36_03640 [Candidatus Poribacteria bacterium]|nr:hypothetical protein [Candidatus Poribacteria bacterium]
MPDVAVHRLLGHNHLFQRAKIGLVNEYAAIKETISPEVLDLIRDWVLSVTWLNRHRCQFGQKSIANESDLQNLPQESFARIEYME